MLMFFSTKQCVLQMENVFRKIKRIAELEIVEGFPCNMKLHKICFFNGTIPISSSPQFLVGFCAITAFQNEFKYY